jgi:hypothetical protein
MTGAIKRFREWLGSFIKIVALRVTPLPLGTSLNQGKKFSTMKLSIVLSVALSGAVLTACSSASGDTADASITDANKVVDEATPLPPSIAESRPYRCKDGTVVFVDFMSDKKTAHLRLKKDGAPIELKSEAENGPFAGTGYTVVANAAETGITLPEKSEQSCKA